MSQIYPKQHSKQEDNVVNTSTRKRKRLVCQGFYTQQRMSFQKQTKQTVLKFSNLCNIEEDSFNTFYKFF